MKRLVLGLLGGALILVVGFATSGHPQPLNQQNSAIAWTAPFRDGIYLANLDRQLGRSPHLRTGRWSADADRAAFVAGYEQVSRPFLPASGPENDAFRRGVNDGAQARQAERPFAVKARLTEASDDPHAANNSPSSSYVDGYQLGYYSQTESLESLLLR